MKRILCIILALLLLCPTAYAEDPQMVYRLNGEPGKVGDIIKLTLSVENAPSIATFDTMITYDPEVLQPTGDYQKMEMNGLMAVNTDAIHEDQKVIKVAAVKVLGDFIKGNMSLLNISFKIIGESKDPQGSKVDVADFNFALDNEELSPVESLLLQPARILVAPSDAPTEEPQEQPDENKTTETEKEDEGEWFFAGDQAVEFYPQDPDKSNQYTVEYEKDESGKTTGVILYDQEDKKEAGRLDVTEDEYGNLNVTEEHLKGDGFSLWFLLPIGAAVLIAVGGVILAIKIKKNK